MIDSESTFLDKTLVQGTAAISLFGCLLVLLSYAHDPLLRSRVIASKYIFFIALCNLGSCVGFIIPVDEDSSQTLCDVQGFVVQFFVLASFIWACVFSIYIQTHATKGLINRRPDPYEKCFGLTVQDLFIHGIVWGIALFCSFFPLGMNAYELSGPWCWISQEQPILRFVLFFLPYILSLVISAVFLFRYWRHTKKNANGVEAIDSEDIANSAVQRRLWLYLAVNMMAWGWSLVRRVYQTASGTDSATLATISYVFAPLHGIANCFVYSISLPAFRETFRVTPLPVHKDPITSQPVQNVSPVPKSEDGNAGVKLMAVLAFFALAFARGVLPLAEAEADGSFSILIMNCLRSVIGWFLFSATIGSVRLRAYVLRRRANGYGLLNEHEAEYSRNKAQSLEDNTTFNWTSAFLSRMVVMTLLQSTLPVLFIAYANLLIPSGLTAALVSTTSLFSLIIKRMVSPVKPDPSIPAWIGSLTIVGIFVGLGGAAMVCLPQFLVQAKDHSNPANSVGGIFLALLSALSWALAGVFNEKHLARYDTVIKSWYAQLFSAVICLILALIFELASGTFVVKNTAEGWGWMMFLGFLVSYVSNFLNYFLLDTIGAVLTASVWYLVPFVGLVIGAIAEHEWAKFSPAYIAIQCCGCVVIVLGLLLTVARQIRQWYLNKFGPKSAPEPFEEERPRAESRTSLGSRSSDSNGSPRKEDASNANTPLLSAAQDV